jgi:hypothetical protein
MWLGGSGPHAEFIHSLTIRELVAFSPICMFRNAALKIALLWACVTRSKSRSIGEIAPKRRARRRSNVTKSGKFGKCCEWRRNTTGSLIALRSGSAGTRDSQRVISLLIDYLDRAIAFERMAADEPIWTSDPSQANRRQAPPLNFDTRTSSRDHTSDRPACPPSFSYGDQDGHGRRR